MRRRKHGTRYARSCPLSATCCRRKAVTWVSEWKMRSAGLCRRVHKSPLAGQRYSRTCPATSLGRHLAALAQNDLVLGPASGRRLLLDRSDRREVWNRTCSGAFPGARPQVLALTCRPQNERASRSICCRNGSDVDQRQDLKALAGRNRNTAFACSRTMAYLRKGGSL